MLLLTSVCGQICGKLMLLLFSFNAIFFKIQMRKPIKYISWVLLLKHHEWNLLISILSFFANVQIEKLSYMCALFVY